MGLGDLYPHYLFHCRNHDCGVPILLRVEMLWQQPGIQEFHTTGILSLALVCPRCRQVRSYSMVKESPNYDPTAKLVTQDQISDAHIAGKLQCVGESCGFRLPLFALESIPIDYEDRQKILAAWEWKEVRCHKGHPVAKPKILNFPP